MQTPAPTSTAEPESPTAIVSMQPEATPRPPDDEDPPPVWHRIGSACSHANFWVKDTDRRFSKSFGRLLRHCGIIASEWTALRELYRPRRHNFLELVAKIGMSKGGASKLVSRLEAKGLVTKGREGFDRRYVGIALTETGKEFVVQIAALEKDTDRRFFGPLGNTRRFRMTESMQRFLLNANHIQRLCEWVRRQLKEKTLIRVSRNAAARAAAEAQRQSDELYDAYKRLGERIALGDKTALDEIGAIIRS